MNRAATYCIAGGRFDHAVIDAPCMSVAKSGTTMSVYCLVSIAGAFVGLLCEWPYSAVVSSGKVEEEVEEERRNVVDSL